VRFAVCTTPETNEMPLPGRANSGGLRAVGMFFLYLLIYVVMFF
jgi:hypothetical protein